jgi:hypothetical protein
MKNWKERWFILTPTKLAYYQMQPSSWEEAETLLKSEMSLEGASVGLATTMFQGRPYVFKVENGSEHVFVEGKSHGEMMRWVTEIKKAIQGKAMTVEEKEAEEEEKRLETERRIQEAQHQQLLDGLMAMGARARFRAAMEAGETELMENAAAELLQSLWSGRKARMRVAALREEQRREEEERKEREKSESKKQKKQREDQERKQREDQERKQREEQERKQREEQQEQESKQQQPQDADDLLSPDSFVFTGREHKKKLSSERMFRHRFVWVDMARRTFNWSKNNSRDGKHKEVDLSEVSEVSREVPRHGGKQELAGHYFTLAFSSGVAGIEICCETVEECDVWVGTLQAMM